MAEAVGTLAARMPTYITLKDVKKRWGKGQEDVFPVAQFEKLWGDMTALPSGIAALCSCRASGAAVEGARAVRWLAKGRVAAFVERFCDWEAGS